MAKNGLRVIPLAGPRGADRDMTSILKTALRHYWPRGLEAYRIYRDVLSDPDAYLRTTGWLSSLDQGRPVALDGSPVPWMNYPMVELLRRRLASDARIFEFGSGHSTRFLAGIARSVDSLEYDQQWLELVRSTLPSNARIHFQAKDVDGAYCRFIQTMSETYDLVLVDGRDRVNCVRQALSCLTDRGVIVLDDSDRERYLDAFDCMKAAGFSELTLTGLKPGSVRAEMSTVFYRPGNVLAL